MSYIANVLKKWMLRLKVKYFEDSNCLGNLLSFCGMS